jgi:hypothetical protein
MIEQPREYVRLDVSEWPSLWLDVSVNIANAPLRAFAVQALGLGIRVAKGELTRAEAAEALQAAAHYNQLSFYYGNDRLQEIMAAAFNAASEQEVAK